MRRAGRWMILLPLTAMALLSLAAFIAYAFHQSYAMLGLAPLFLMIMIPGAILWLAGWILDGFAKDTH